MTAVSPEETGDRSIDGTLASVLGSIFRGQVEPYLDRLRAKNEDRRARAKSDLLSGLQDLSQALGISQGAQRITPMERSPRKIHSELGPALEAGQPVAEAARLVAEYRAKVQPAAGVDEVADQLRMVHRDLDSEQARELVTSVCDAIARTLGSNSKLVLPFGELQVRPPVTREFTMPLTPEERQAGQAPRKVERTSKTRGSFTPRLDG